MPDMDNFIFYARKGMDAEKAEIAKDMCDLAQELVDAIQIGRHNAGDEVLKVIDNILKDLKDTVIEPLESLKRDYQYIQTYVPANEIKWIRRDDK